MIYNYLKVAFRNLAKNRIFTLLNISGLSVGIGAGLMMLLWVQREYLKNNYPDAARIYRINAHMKSGTGTDSWPYTSAAVGPHGQREIPEIEQMVRVSTRQGEIDLHLGDKVVFEKNAAYVDSTFFQFFHIPLLQGNPDKPFTAPNSIVLTESTARRLFGDENPVGKIIQRGEKAKDLFTISGIMADWPAFADFDYNYVMNFERLNLSWEPRPEMPKYEDTWGMYSMFTFAKLHPGADMRAAEQKISELNARHNENPTDNVRLSLQPVQQLALYDASGSDTGAQTARIFLFAALFVLGIACINYINLTTAQATRRAREVGMRKIIGAEKRQLLGQFMLESVLVTGTAFIVGVLLVKLLLPLCNDFLQQKISLNLNNPAILRLLAGAFAGILLLSGIYPALVLARFKPMQVLKGRVKAGNNRTAVLRKGLVILQFALSVILLCGTLMIGRQLDFILHRDSGFNREQVFSFAIRPGMLPHQKAIIDELKKTAGVEQVTRLEFPILGSANTTAGIWDGKADDSNINFYYFNVDENTDQVFQLTLKSGAWFSGTEADSNRYIVNETAVKVMGLSDPVGKSFALGGGQGVIHGVVKDFNFNSVRENIRPMAFFCAPENSTQYYVRCTAQRTAQVLAAAENLWKKYETTYPFSYTFVDESYARMYQSEKRVSVVFQAFSGIAMLIACLGLFGLATFMAAQRTREIGIRKVLGASVAGITTLLAREFLQLVLIAILLGSPVAWYLMQRWLDNFAYRAELPWWLFAGAGVLALLVAGLTISVQSIRAALINPVRSIKE